jgi:Do/DeqQ family serine protease
MSVRRLLFIVLLLACGFAAGLVLTGRMRGAADSRAQGAASRAPEVTPPGPAGTLPDFSRVASQTVPAVTNISSLQIVRRSNSPFANDPFFQYFFGDPNEFFGSRRGVESSLGSGVIVSSDGYVLTNNHVVTGESGQLSARNLPAITVALTDRRELQAEIVGVDPSTDLALLKIETRNLPTMPWGDSSALKVAEWVLAIGNPFQLNQTVTLGIVSAVGRSVGLSEYEDFIQTDAAINPGNSGGALVNSRGELVGINTAIYSQSGGYQGIGFAVPSNVARRVMNDLIQYGEVRRGSIGYVVLAPMTTHVAEELGAPGPQGALVRQMRRDSAAYEAGVRPGDIIISFNGQAVVDPAHFSRLVQDARIGSTAALGIFREGRKLEVRVPIEQRGGRQ